MHYIETVCNYPIPVLLWGVGGWGGIKSAVVRMNKPMWPPHEKQKNILAKKQNNGIPTILGQGALCHSIQKMFWAEKR